MKLFFVAVVNQLFFEDAFELVLVGILNEFVQLLLIDIQQYFLEIFLLDAALKSEDEVDGLGEVPLDQNGLKKLEFFAILDEGDLD